jgi:hypothetical protein
MSWKTYRKDKSSFPILTTIIVVGLLVFLYIKKDYLLDLFAPHEPFGTAPPVEQTKRDNASNHVVEATRRDSAFPEQEKTADRSPPLLRDPEQPPRKSCAEIRDTTKAHMQYLASFFDRGAPPADKRIHLDQLIRQLLGHPPVVVRETDNLNTIQQNLIHFFRILGPADILTVKEILGSEPRTLEQTMAVLYTWSENYPECSTSGEPLALPLENLYEYAGFFLNTLGGRGYLFRRDPGQRLLVQYYAVLILDRAETASLNRYGLDIRPPLAALVKEMENAEYLAGRDHYLEKLYSLEGKYLAKYGPRNDAGG